MDQPLRQSTPKTTIWEASNLRIPKVVIKLYFSLQRGRHRLAYTRHLRAVSCSGVAVAPRSVAAGEPAPCPPT